MPKPTDQLVGLVDVAVTDLGRIESTLNLGLEQIDAARIGLLALRDQLTGGAR